MIREIFKKKKDLLLTLASLRGEVTGRLPTEAENRRAQINMFIISAEQSNTDLVSLAVVSPVQAWAELFPH